MLPVVDKTLDELWRIDVGSDFNAPPLTYAVNSKRYIAIASDLYCDGRGGPLSRSLALAPQRMQRRT
jgi:hypothetical protein